MVISLLLIPVALWAIYKYFVYHYRYWETRGFPILPELNPLLMISEFQGQAFEKMYYKARNSPYFGTFRIFRPLLVLRDPEVIRTILTKHFSSFPDRDIFVHKSDKLMHQNLFTSTGEKWHMDRTKLATTFSSGKLKGMVSIISNCAQLFDENLKSRAGSVVDTQDICGSFTTDVICRCAFGLETEGDMGDELRAITRRILVPDFLQIISMVFTGFVTEAIPCLNNYIYTRTVNLKDEKFILKLVRDTVDYRAKHGSNKGDFLDILIELRKELANNNLNGKNKDNPALEQSEISDEFIAAQCFVFFLGGYEETNSGLIYALYELALNPDVQDRTREDIFKATEKHGGLNYESLQDMTYLDMVMAETLRKYPTMNTLIRECKIKYTMPGGEIVDKGTAVTVPVWALHYDPEHFPDPHKFDPERFSQENKYSIRPGTYLPFGDGPRMCIGMRYAKIVMKMGVATVLKNYSLERAAETEVPLEFNPKVRTTHPLRNIKLKLNSNIFTSCR